MSQLTVELRTEDDRTVVEVVGELDLSTVQELADAFERADRSGGRTLVLDASGLTFCDSAGLRVLMEARHRGAIALRSPSDALRRLLELTGTADRFEVI